MTGCGGNAPGFNYDLAMSDQPPSPKMGQGHVAVATEAVAAALFARCGYDVSVQYGANQSEYNLAVIRGERMLKVSVKGSQDGGWGLTQSYLKKGKAKPRVDRRMVRPTQAPHSVLLRSVH